MIKLFLFDIEGTTTDINFVHKVLFPYSSEKMGEFLTLHQHDPSIQDAVKDVQQTVLKEQGKNITFPEMTSVLLDWIRQDRKHPALKEIQGHIWDLGYSKNHFHGHIYDDVKKFFLKILESGAKIGIYSSGSVHAQKLIFGYSTQGDITPLITYYFDTKIGEKRERTSYSNISNAVKLSPEEIIFFSDILEELKAAESAGFQVVHVQRSERAPSPFRSIASFDEYS